MKDELLELMANMTDAQLSAVIERLPNDQKEHLSIIAQEYGEALKRERGQKHFMDFVKIMWPNFIGGRHHGIMANAFERVARGELKRLIINMPPRHRLSLDTPIPTTAGWKTIESVAVGDFVFAPDGSPVEVTGKSEVFTELLYEVTTSDGQTIECDGEHLWTVRFGSSRPYETLSTAEILRKLNTESWRTLGNLPMLPRQAAAQYPRADLPVDPYVLGVWLGDGSSGSSSVGCSYADLSQMQSQVEACGYSVTHNPKFQQFNILGLLSQLRELGVLNNKHIPEQYLCASIEQRMALLQGLIDTDGDVTKDGKVTFNQTSLELTKQVLCLIHSLGVKARITHRQTSYKGMPSKPSHRIMFKLANAARIPRKAVRCKAPEGNWSRSIDVKQTTKTGQVQCLEVANPDGLFMAGRGWVVTHNTKSEFASYLLPAWFLGNFPDKKIIQSSNTADLAVGFGRKVRNLVDGEIYSKVFPNVSLRHDSKAAGRWSTNSNGEYFAIGVGGTVTGKGADLLIIDDPHALPLDTHVPTPQGFKTIGELAIGDEVFGPDGLPTRVTAKSDVYKSRELYKLTTDDGEEVLCDGGHLWSYHSDTNLKNSHLVKTATARDLANWNKPNKPYLPRHMAVQHPKAELLIDPYVLGAWLGDGTSTVGRMTAHPDDAPFMKGEFLSAGYETTELTDPYSFGVKGLWTQLKFLGLIGNKHIPEAYLHASVDQRLAVIQGMMDTDGNVTVQGECSFNNCSELLARQFRELLHSLGVKAKICVYYDARPNHNPVYRVNFKLADCCRMPRKRERTFTPTDKRRRSISVKPSGICSDVQCITVDRADGLFLVGRGYVVTHNSEQEAKLAESDPTVFDSVHEWYTSGPRQRLQPGGSIVIVMCMTGDTPVLMADGVEIPLAKIRPGDAVATFENGRLAVTKVNNWKSNGVDSIYRIQTESGKILRANERHPFLVMNEGVLEWTRLKHLRPGAELVALKGAQDPQELKQSRGCAQHACQKSHITAKTRRHLENLSEAMGSGLVKIAYAGNRSSAKDCASSATENNTGHPAKAGSHQRSNEGIDSNLGTGSRQNSTTKWFRCVITVATCAVSRLLTKMSGRIGTANCALTTATTQEKCEGFYVMTATSRSDTEKRQIFSDGLRRISDFTTDPIISIEPDGKAEVFDVEIDRTENFIANGVVSHNTRWSKRDLTGRVLKDSAQRGGDEWEVIEFPAILPSDKPLWPEFWTYKELDALRTELPNAKWQAQYQQNPTSEGGAIVKREWWQRWEKDDPPPCEFIIQSWDTAFLKSERADYSACTTWGVFSNIDETGKSQSNIILLNAFKKRMEFPELKQRAYQEFKEWEVDSLIVEAKAAGSPLIFELRAMGIPVQEFSPTKGNDKIARLNAVADIFASGMVWVPNTNWAEELIEEVASFPAGDHDDLVDSMTQALLRYRKGGFIRLASDEEDEPVYRQKRSYY